MPLPARLAPSRLALAIAVAAGTASGGASANPTGAQVIHGSASFANPAAGVLNITNSAGAVLNWQSFDIGAGEITRFIQPSAASAVLNRVVSGDPSEILGTLASNGHVFLINQNGILFGRNATVDTAGLVASTLNLSDADFLAGRMNFTGPPEAGPIRNEGYIKTAANGTVVLIAPNIENSGIIETPGGELVLAAGHSVSLVTLDSDYMSFEVTAPDGVTVNLGSLLAQGGAARVFSGSIRNAGTIAADSVALGANGVVELRATRGVALEAGSTIAARGGADADGGAISITVDASADGAAPTRLTQGGTLDASGVDGGSVRLEADDVELAGATRADGAASGGTIEVIARGDVEAAATAVLSAQGGTGQGGGIDVRAGDRLASGAIHDARGDTGGTVRLLANEEVVLGGALIDVRGDHGGGQARVGGGFAGGEDLPEARTTTVDSLTRVRADAITDGDAGKVAIWAGEETDFHGQILARGGRDGGDGGMVEVSGKTLTHAGTVNVTARRGNAGTLLLDPQFIVVKPGVIAGSITFNDPDPGADNFFGADFDCFAGGVNSGCGGSADRILFYDYLDDTRGADAGALHLFDLQSGAKLSSLYGAAAGDEIGSSGFTTIFGLAPGSILIRSPAFNGSGGAFTPFNLATGLSGTVSGANSISGNPGDLVTSSSLQQFLLPGKVVLFRSAWGGNRGAVTVLNASNFSFASSNGYGTIGSTNSLVGATAGDFVGSSFTQTLSSNVYYIRSPNFNGSAGALTPLTGGAPPTDVVSGANSIIGANPGDGLGNNGINASTIGGVGLIFSPDFNGGRGAVTAFNPLTGLLKTGGLGPIGAGNSLVGSVIGDNVGSGGLLSTGDRGWVHSPDWNGGAGALTFFHTGGVPTNAITASNSVIGAAPGDALGGNGIYRFSISGRTLVLSPDFNGGDGAITVLDNATGQFVNGGGFGAVDNSNSLTGNAGDFVGDGGVTTTGLGGAFVHSTAWNGNAGALTFFDASIAPVNTVAPGNSIVGAPGDFLGADGISAVTISGQTWVFSGDFGGGAGAVTVLDSATGEFLVGGGSGQIDNTNSLIGAAAGDNVGANGTGDVINVPGGGRFLYTPDFSGSGGALTFFSASITPVDEVSVTNSIVGDVGDQFGSDDIDTSLLSGKTVVFSGAFGGGTGAVTVLDNADGTFEVGGGFGTVDTGNSLLGAGIGDGVGGGGSNDFIELDSGGWLLHTPGFNGSAGALTYFDDTTIATGTLGIGNSVVGDAPGANLGSDGIEPFLLFGKVLVFSPDALGTAGAVTVLDDVDGTFAVGGVLGAIAGANSLTGSVGGDNVGSGGYEFLANGGLLIHSPDWNSNAGALTYLDASNVTVGAVGAGNSIIGNPGDAIGSGGINADDFFGGITNRVIVFSPDWSSGTGAVTLLNVGDGSFAVGGGYGLVGGGNSLVGSNPGDQVGSGEFVSTGNGFGLVHSPDWDGGAGAWTFMSETVQPTGPVSASESIIGNPGDGIGSNGINTFTVDGVVLLFSSGFGGGLGAITMLDHATGQFLVGGGFGIVDQNNSLVGVTPGDNVGNLGPFSSITNLDGTHYVLRNSLAAGGAGAITWFDRTAGIAGEVDDTTSLVGSTPGDNIGSAGIGNLDGASFAVASPSWTNGGNASAGAYTVGSIDFGLTGTVGPGNSLVGSNALDRVGNNGVFSYVGFGNAGNRYYRIPTWNNNAGALALFMAGQPAPTGVVDATNSLLGAVNGDGVGNASVQTLFGSGAFIFLPNWDNGAVADAGAVVVVPDAGRVGAISAANSLVGTVAGDRVGSSGAQFLSSSSYVIRSPQWHGSAGALTFISPTKAPVGELSATNSFVGATAGDGVSSVTFLSAPGKLAIRTPFWDNGAAVDAGAFTIADIATGITGTPNATVSLVGTHTDDRIGSNGFATDPTTFGLALNSDHWNANTGAVTLVNPNSPVVGAVNGGNSFIGSRADDFIGSGGILPLDNGRFMVISPEASATDAAGNVLANAGRVDIIGGVGGLGNPAQFRFDFSPSGTATLGATDISNFLATGATLILQAHSDISFLEGADIFSKDGYLSLQAGRSIIIEASIDPVQIDLFANVVGGGVNPQFRLPGDGNVIVRAGANPVRVEADILNVAGQNVIVEGGDGPDAFAALLGNKVSIKAGTLQFLAGAGANADAVLLVPTGLLDLEVGACIGCDELNFDPLLDPATQTGIFKGFPDFTVAIDALLALGDPLTMLADGEGEEDERKLKQCK